MPLGRCMLLSICIFSNPSFVRCSVLLLFRIVVPAEKARPIGGTRDFLIGKKRNSEGCHEPGVTKQASCRDGINVVPGFLRHVFLSWAGPGETRRLSVGTAENFFFLFFSSCFYDKCPRVFPRRAPVSGNVEQVNHTGAGVAPRCLFYWL